MAERTEREADVGADHEGLPGWCDAMPASLVNRDADEIRGGAKPDRRRQPAVGLRVAADVKEGVTHRLGVPRAQAARAEAQQPAIPASRRLVGHVCRLERLRASLTRSASRRVSASNVARPARVRA